MDDVNVLQCVGRARKSRARLTKGGKRVLNYRHNTTQHNTKKHYNHRKFRAEIYKDLMKI